MSGEWRAHVERRFPFDTFNVHLAKITPTHIYAVKWAPHELEEVEEGAARSEPSFQLQEGEARALYDALGRALNVHTPDARMAAEVLAREQGRVDKLIDAFIARRHMEQIPTVEPPF